MGGKISPGWGCNEALVKELVAELQARKVPHPLTDSSAQPCTPHGCLWAGWLTWVQHCCAVTCEPPVTLRKLQLKQERCASCACFAGRARQYCPNQDTGGAECAGGAPPLQDRCRSPAPPNPCAIRTCPQMQMLRETATLPVVSPPPPRPFSRSETCSARERNFWSCTERARPGAYHEVPAPSTARAARQHPRWENPIFARCAW